MSAVRMVVFTSFILSIFIHTSLSIMQGQNLHTERFEYTIPGLGTFGGTWVWDDVGRWWVKDPTVQMQTADQTNYYIVKTADKNSYAKATEQRINTGTISPDFAVPNPECKPSLTEVRGGVACAGQIIFEENFDTFRDDIWQIEQYIPVNTPDFPFVSYQRLTSQPTVSVEDGVLRIAPKLQEELPGFTTESIYTGSLDLGVGCTSSAEACFKQSSGADILPPVVSGKITSKGFAFMYGTVTVRAKLPKGDWLYPEILLEPFLQKYGALHYSSGILEIASARGNEELRSGYKDYSNKVLTGGPIMDNQCYDTLLKRKTSGENWGDNYHVYSMRWAPDGITLSVDGEQWASLLPRNDGLQSHFSWSCSHLPRTLLRSSTKMAPFDDFFYITLGVAAGGNRKFPDGVTTANRQQKPWRNPSRKGLLRFWRDMNTWSSTWNQPEMLVDYVRVVAL